MLAQTVRSNLTNIKQLKNRNKTTKFSSLFQTAPTAGNKDPEIVQVLMKAGLVNVSEDDSLFDEISVPETIEIVEEEQNVDFDEISEYIVENPNEVVVNFPISPVIELEEKLPFFKSVSLKLDNLFSNIEQVQCS